MDQITFHYDTVLSDIHLLLPNSRHLMACLNRVGQPGTGDTCDLGSPCGGEELDRDTQEEKGRGDARGSETGADGREDGGADGGEDGGADGGEDGGADGGEDGGADGVEDGGADGGEDGGEDGGVEPPLDEDGDLEVTRRQSLPRRDRDRDMVYPIILSQARREEEEEEEAEEECPRDVIRIANYVQRSHRLGVGGGDWADQHNVGEDLLSMCQKNVMLNRHLMEPAGGEVRVRLLDWLRHDLCTDADTEFGWTEDEVADLHDNTTVIIAADVCYDDDLTDALFRTLYRICNNLHLPCTTYLSIEKR
ncbi:unnamed protein product [Coregonus sp. 'balchen']|nr:unnamed protein product [Coregonus sp. 'balchen']